MKWYQIAVVTILLLTVLVVMIKLLTLKNKQSSNSIIVRTWQKAIKCCTRFIKK